MQVSNSDVIWHVNYPLLIDTLSINYLSIQSSIALTRVEQRVALSNVALYGHLYIEYSSFSVGSPTLSIVRMHSCSSVSSTRAARRRWMSKREVDVIAKYHAF
jgi:hypothetical protein